MNFILLSFIASIVHAHNDGSDYYGKLGVEKNASTKEIRKAFKKLAFTMHPDKSDDPNAHEKFMEINKIYEVLKDDELRKKYDRWGEKGLEDGHNGGRYESWDFYHQELGLYDEDEQIHVLDHKLLEEAMASEDVWFIKFYSERCSHCHDLAPSWRQVAIELEGIVKIGAISCRDYRRTCSALNVQSYPTLMLFAKNARRYVLWQGGKKIRQSQGKYKGQRNTAAIVEYALANVRLKVTTLSTGAGAGMFTNRPTVYILSDSDGDFTIKEFPDIYRLQAALGDVVNLVKLPCENVNLFAIRQVLCGKRQTEEGGVIYFKIGENPKEAAGLMIESFDAFEIAQVVFDQIELPRIVSEADFDERVLSGFRRPLILILDGNQFSTNDKNKLKLLPNYLATHKEEYYWLPPDGVRRLDCHQFPSLCVKMEAGGHNKVIVFTGRSVNEYEVYHGKIEILSILEFATTVVTHRMFTVTPRNVDQLLSDGSEWLLDFSAPWCPPCNNFLPDVRQASLELKEKGVKVGYVDCEAHKSLCTRYKIKSYPTIQFFGTDSQGKPVQEEFDGDHTWEELIEFYSDVKNPSVAKLTAQTFYRDVIGREDGVIWMIDFAASWCPPCKRMFPEFKQTAKELDGLVKFGYVECPEMEQVCSGYGVSSYPSIFVFPAKTAQNPLPDHRKFNQHQRNTWSFMQFLTSEMQKQHPVVTGTNLGPDALQDHINYAFKRGNYILIDFFANWCRPCQQFSPYFRLAAAHFPRVQFIAVDCVNGNGQRHCQRFNIRQYPTVYLLRPNDGAITQTRTNFRIDEIETHFDIRQFADELRKYLPIHMKNAPAPHDEL